MMILRRNETQQHHTKHKYLPEKNISEQTKRNSFPKKQHFCTKHVRKKQQDNLSYHIKGTLLVFLTHCVN